MFPPIDLASFSWEAFATLITGVAAVGAAWWVGQRQTAIARMQTAILDRQVRLDELKYRADLFDRRWKVYDETRKFLSVIGREGAPAAPADENAFLAAASEARFLFDAKTSDQLWEIWKLAATYRGNRRVLEVTHDEARRRALAEKDADMHERLWEELKNLPDLFGDALRLA